MHFNILPG